MKTTVLSASLLSWLRCFETVARQQSFTLASKELCITQSAISQQIKKLEQHLGVGLIERSRSGLKLTVEGSQLYLATNSSFTKLTEIIESFEIRNNSKFLELVSVPSFSLRWLMPKLASFYSRYPHVSLRVRADFHTLDYGIRNTGQDLMALTYGTMPDESLNPIKILDEWITPVATPKFLARNKHIKNIEDLEANQLLHDDVAWDGSSAYAEWDYWFSKVGVEMSSFAGGQRYNLSTLATEAAIAEQGIALGRAALITDDIQNQRLVCVFNKTVISPASYWLISSSKSKHTETVTQWLKSEVQSYKRIRNKLIPAPI